MTNIQQPEMRRSGESPTSKQRTEDANPTDAPGGTHDKTGDSPVPDTLTTSSSGPLDFARVSVGTAALTASPTSTYTAPARTSAPNSARG